MRNRGDRVGCRGREGVGYKFGVGLVVVPCFKHICATRLCSSRSPVSSYYLRHLYLCFRSAIENDTCLSLHLFLVPFHHTFLSFFPAFHFPSVHPLVALPAYIYQPTPRLVRSSRSIPSNTQCFHPPRVFVVVFHPYHRHAGSAKAEST